MWGEGKMAKEKKHVTFAYVPAYKDEDDDTYKNSKSMRKTVIDHTPDILKLKEEIDKANL